MDVQTILAFPDLSMLDFYKLNCALLIWCGVFLLGFWGWFLGLFFLMCKCMLFLEAAKSRLGNGKK